MNHSKADWQPPDLQGRMLCGDMPGESVLISDAHIRKANAIFPSLLDTLRSFFELKTSNRAVISIYGGSGSGKSGTASVLTHYLRYAGLETYCLSGDNYPHRIPVYNDAERLRIFRLGGIRGLISGNLYTPEARRTINELQAQDKDSNVSMDYPWLEQYISSGRAALAAYLGSPDEIDFREINHVINQFRNGEQELFLKRMGREPASLWYEKVSFKGIKALIIEWTHGNSKYLQGIDFPIFLMSTPQETLNHRQARNRDNAIDSPFTSLVLDIEQGQLMAQLPRARIIISFDGKRMDSKELLNVQKNKGNYQIG